MNRLAAKALIVLFAAGLVHQTAFGQSLAEQGANVTRIKTAALADPFFVPPPPEPEIPEEELPFSYDIASYSTNYGKGATNRNHNMRLAVEAVNGTVLEPGDAFSYNGVILEKSDGGRGYLPAGILIDGKPGTGVGGGICQVSSTLYQAALYSGMTILERISHSIPLDYMPAGRDATVTWGGADLRFRNDLSIPVMIEGTIEDGTITMRFRSKEKPDFDTITVDVTYNGRYLITRYVDGAADYWSASRYR